MSLKIIGLSCIIIFISPLVWGFCFEEVISEEEYFGNAYSEKVQVCRSKFAKDYYEETVREFLSLLIHLGKIDGFPWGIEEDLDRCVDYLKKKPEESLDFIKECNEMMKQLEIEIARDRDNKLIVYRIAAVLAICTVDYFVLQNHRMILDWLKGYF